MILIDEIFVSKKIFLTDFSCDLSLCHGDCCRIGERGAPLTLAEAEALENLSKETLAALPLTEQARSWFKMGKSAVEWHRSKPYTAMMLKELSGFCLLSALEGKLILCALEKLPEELKHPKPISCHLFPIREQEFLGRRYLTFETRDECADAFGRGQPLIYALKAAIIREFGDSFYEKLKKKMKELRTKGGKNKK